MQEMWEGALYNKQGDDRGMIMRRYIYGLGLVLAAPLVFGTMVHAYPTYSPSAREAARLKNNPPRGWLGHYLGDDRYKIAGKIWKLVSTPNDTQSYPAWAPEMLSRPASNVIGFSSVEDAVEAGYPPSGRYGSAFPDYVKEGGTAPTGGVTTVNRGGKSIRITLADGRSTVELPPNWRRTQSGATTLFGSAANSDVLQPLNGGGSIRISTIVLPAGVLSRQPASQRQLTPESMRMSMRGMGGSQIANAVGVGSAKVGGIGGVMLTPKVAGGVPLGQRGRLDAPTAFANIGDKVYIVENKSGGVMGTNSILGSLRPR